MFPFLILIMLAKQSVEVAQVLARQQEVFFWADVYPIEIVMGLAPLNTSQLFDLQKCGLGRVIISPETEITLMSRLIKWWLAPKLRIVIAIAPEHRPKETELLQGVERAMSEK